MFMVHPWWSSIILGRLFLKSFFLLTFLNLVSGVACAGEGISIVDDFGNRVGLNHPARRIVALYGSFNEVLYAMDLGGTLVGRTAADHYPAAITELPSIGTHMRPNLELIVALKPDLVLQMAGRSQAATSLELLKSRGIACALFKVTSFEEMFSMIRRLGVLTASSGRAGQLVASMEKRLAAAASRGVVSGVKPSVFFEVRYPNLLAAGQGSIVSDIINRAGGVNSVNNAKKIVRLGEEELFRLNPENYVYQVGYMNPSPLTPGQREHFKMLEAVAKGRILKVDESVFSRPGPRNVEAVEILADFLFPKKEK